MSDQYGFDFDFDDETGSEPYRRNSDPSTARVGAQQVYEREGKKGQIRRGSGRHIALLVLVRHPGGISGYDAGREMFQVFGFGRTGQDPPDIGRRRVNEVAKLGAASRENNLYLPNLTTQHALDVIDVAGEWHP